MAQEEITIWCFKYRNKNARFEAVIMISEIYGPSVWPQRNICGLIIPAEQDC